ncbi:MAG: hypothetical protein DMG93_00430 [Acidobacteria bacterium]|nr:MAG: hypothetical protein DMG93_00430 [Acidobacteriota bacterium]
MAAAAAVGLRSDFRWFVGFWEFADFNPCRHGCVLAPQPVTLQQGTISAFLCPLLLSAVKASALLRDGQTEVYGDS